VWCSGRAHGNVGDHVGDDPEVVARNRAMLSGLVGAAEPGAWVWIRQVHGADVHVATGREVAPAAVADAVVTAERGLALAVVTADCAPLVIASDDAVGVVHAGHSGLAAGVIEAAVDRLRDIGSGRVRAFLGPCIRAGDYEFGARDLERFAAQFGPQVVGRTRDGKPALDMTAAIRVIADRVGIRPDDFNDTGISTAASEAYFSYRRHADSGRQATIVLLP
jgi:YfiH family protein